MSQISVGDIRVFFLTLFIFVEYDSEFSMGDHMFHDLEISREFADAFHAKPHIEGTSAQNLTVMVLQRSFWPFNSRPAKKEDVLLPAKVCLFWFCLIKATLKLTKSVWSL